MGNELVSRMKPGSVLVDIAVDQGGCFEDSRPTTHDDPTFRVHDSVFYCVANMPGAVPNTSTHALTNVTLPYVMALANEGTAAAVRAHPDLAQPADPGGGEELGVAAQVPAVGGHRVRRQAALHRQVVQVSGDDPCHVRSRRERRRQERTSPSGTACIPCASATSGSTTWPATTFTPWARSRCARTAATVPSLARAMT